MRVVRFVRGYLMYQPGETAGFADDVAQSLIDRGAAVDPAAAKAAAAEAAAAEAAAQQFQAARLALVQEAMLKVGGDGYTKSGKPDVEAVNAQLPGGADPVTAAERDAAWSDMQDT